MCWLLLLLACGQDDILTAADEATPKSSAGSARPPQGPADEAGPGGALPIQGGHPVDEAAPGGGSPMAPSATLSPGVAPLPGAAQTPIPGAAGQATPGAAGQPTPGVGQPTPVKAPDPAPAPPGTPQPNAGPQVTISGTVTFATYKSGAIRITVFDGDHSKPSSSPPRVLGMAEIQSPGAFSLTVPEASGKVYLEGSIDEDGDGRPGPQEPAGKADRYPVTVGTAPVAGITVTMERIAPPPSGPRKEDF